MHTLAARVICTWLVTSVSVVYGAPPSPCATVLSASKSVQLSIASGYRVSVVATGLARPRSIQFDTDGNLLVVQGGLGITALSLQDDGEFCVTAKSKKSVISNTEVSYFISSFGAKTAELFFWGSTKN